MKKFADFGIDLNGKTGVEVKTTCPQCSTSRKKKNYPCLNVNTDKGVWHCWHCDWRGSLGKGVENHSNPQAWKRKEFVRPEYIPQGLTKTALDWFQKRGIGVDVLERNKIGYGTIYMPQVEEEVTAIQFPYHRAGQAVNIKYRDSQKNFRMVGGAERILYGLDDVEPITVVVEGEIDKLSVEVAGFRNCVSVPDGAPAPNTKNYSSKFDYLDSAAEKIAEVKTFILAVDNDPPGHRLEEELARRLGRERCKRVTWPEGCKDANEVLVRHGAEAIQDAIEHAEPFPVAGLYEAKNVFSSVDRIYVNGFPEGQKTGWESLDDFYRVMPGQWTLVTGIPSHGKSEFLDALAINLAEQYGAVFGVCSPENQPLDYYVVKLLEKRAGMRLKQMPEGIYADAKAWINAHFKFLLPEDTSLDAVLNLAKVLVFRHGISGLIIDPWNELDHSRADSLSETEHISAALSKIRRFAREYNVHVWLVAHPAKLQREKDGTYGVPRPYDVSGSAHWYNKADNALTVWRDVLNHDTPTQIHVQKVRFRWCGRPGLAELHYDMRTTRYYEAQNAPPVYSMAAEG